MLARHAVVTALVFTLVSPVFASPPEVFTDETYEAASERAFDDAKLFLVDATAVWCGPCKKMDKTTWIDERVVEWIQKHAIALQLDVDKQRPIAKSLKIQAMPTIIVFKEGAEFDRVVGYKNVEDLLAWLDGVLAGRKAIEAIIEAAGDRADPKGAVDVRARLDLARTLSRTNQLDEATDEYVWLWDNMLTHQPAMSGVRVSFMKSDMQRLAQTHPPAKVAFTVLRDRLDAAVQDGSAGRMTLGDWVHLNEIVDDTDCTLAWYDALADDPRREERVRTVDRFLFALLLERKRWADAGVMFRDPVRHAERSIQISDMGRAQMNEEQAAMMAAASARHLRRQLAPLYAALLAADREDEAVSVASLLLENQDNAETRVALVQAALEAGEARPVQLEWLDAAATAGGDKPDVRRSLERALAQSM